MRLTLEQLKQIASTLNRPEFKKQYVELNENNLYPDEIFAHVSNEGRSINASISVAESGQITFDMYQTPSGSEGSIIRRKGKPSWSQKKKH